MTHDASSHPEATVYYDGSCPLCRREIGFYQSCKNADAVSWVDISTAEDNRVAGDLTRDAAMARLHVRDSDGHLHNGGAAFTTLWHALPAFRPLATAFRLPVLRTLVEIGYVAFLKVRPFMHRLMGVGSAKSNR